MSANYAFLQADADNKDNHPLAAKAKKRNCHLDDFAKSIATMEEAVHVYQDVRITLQKGGLNLRKWICNSKRVGRSILEKDRTDEKGKTFEAEPHTSSLLGM